MNPVFLCVCVALTAGAEAAVGDRGQDEECRGGGGVGGGRHRTGPHGQGRGKHTDKGMRAQDRGKGETDTTHGIPRRLEGRSFEC